MWNHEKMAADEEAAWDEQTDQNDQNNEAAGD